MRPPHGCSHGEGMDILVPFLKLAGKVKFLIVIVDYFTKWIEDKNFDVLTEAVVKQSTTTKYNQKVKLRDFRTGDLILRRTDVGRRNAREGKLVANWEGSYRVTTNTGMGAYTLKTLDSSPIPRTWNTDKLKSYYSHWEANSAITCGSNIHQTKVCRLQEYTNNNAPCLTEVQPRSSHTIHVSLNGLRMRCCISQRRLFSHTPT